MAGDELAGLVELEREPVNSERYYLTATAVLVAHRGLERHSWQLVFASTLRIKPGVDHNPVDSRHDGFGVGEHRGIQMRFPNAPRRRKVVLVD